MYIYNLFSFGRSGTPRAGQTAQTLGSSFFHFRPPWDSQGGSNDPDSRARPSFIFGHPGTPQGGSNTPDSWGCPSFTFCHPGTPQGGSNVPDFWYHLFSFSAIVQTTAPKAVREFVVVHGRVRGTTTHVHGVMIFQVCFDFVRFTCKICNNL